MLKDVARHHHNPNLQKAFSRSPSYKAVVLLSCNSSSCLFSTSPEDGTVFRPLNSISTYFNHYMIGLSWKLKSRRIMGVAKCGKFKHDSWGWYSNIQQHTPNNWDWPNWGFKIHKSVSCYQWSINDLAMIYQCYMMLYGAISPSSMVQGAMFTSSTRPSVTISTKAIICACPVCTSPSDYSDLDLTNRSHRIP
jgi:hypothetical protein